MRAARVTTQSGRTEEDKEAATVATVAIPATPAITAVEKIPVAIVVTRGVVIPVATQEMAATAETEVWRTPDRGPYRRW